MAESEPPEDEPEKHAALAVVASPSAMMVVPAMVADLGEAAALRFIDFFTANTSATLIRAQPTPSPSAASSAG